MQPLMQTPHLTKVLLNSCVVLLLLLNVSTLYYFFFNMALLLHTIYIAYTFNPLFCSQLGIKDGELDFVFIAIIL